MKVARIALETEDLDAPSSDTDTDIIASKTLTRDEVDAKKVKRIESKRRAVAARALTRLPQKPVVKTEAEKDELKRIDLTINQLPKAAAAKLQPMRNDLDVIDITADRQKAAEALRVLIDLTKANTPAPTPGSPVKPATLPQIPALKIEKRKKNISGNDTILNKKGVKIKKENQKTT